MYQSCTIKNIRILFLLILIVKIAVVLFIKIFPSDFINLGGDSDYYDEYALGLDGAVSSIWPIMLRVLNDIGFYDRSVISLLLFTLASLIIPFLFASLLPKPTSNNVKEVYVKTYWYTVIIMAIYPTIFFYSFDVYRDVFMVFLIGVCLHVVNTLINSQFKKCIPMLLVFSLLTYLLYLFRPYLGFSIFAALFFYRIEYSNRTIVYLTISFFVLLAFLHSIGVLDPLFVYREIFSDEYAGSGSNIGLNFTEKTSLEFIGLYLYSGILQLFGFYLNSAAALVLFALESIFFILCLFYSIKNWRYLTPFLRYLLVFSLIYGTIWIVANDNLGTATRLRIYNYLAMLIIAASIYLKKYYIPHKSEGSFW